VNPDVTNLLLSVAGTASTHVTIPNAPFLLGATLRNQVVQFELGPQLALSGINSTNAIALTIGQF